MVERVTDWSDVTAELADACTVGSVGGAELKLVMSDIL